MPICKKCQTKFPNRIKIEGKTHNIGNRKYCFSCSPIGNKSFCGPEPKDGIRHPRDQKSSRCCYTCSKVFISKSRNHECSVCRCRKRRMQLKNEFRTRLGNKCLLCGYNKCQDALDFHHLDPSTKKFTLSSNYSVVSRKELEEEFKKCILICSNCHRELHSNQRQEVIEKLKQITTNKTMAPLPRGTTV